MSINRIWKNRPIIQDDLRIVIRIANPLISFAQSFSLIITFFSKTQQIQIKPKNSPRTLQLHRAQLFYGNDMTSQCRTADRSYRSDRLYWISYFLLRVTGFPDRREDTASKQFLFFQRRFLLFTEREIFGCSPLQWYKSCWRSVINGNIIQLIFWLKWLEYLESHLTS